MYPGDRVIHRRTGRAGEVKTTFFTTGKVLVELDEGGHAVGFPAEFECEDGDVETPSATLYGLRPGVDFPASL